MDEEASFSLEPLNVKDESKLLTNPFNSYHRLVPSILEQIPVLIYAGDADFICNWLGNQAWTNRLEWPGKKDFNKAEIKDITLEDGSKYGKVSYLLILQFMN